MIKQCKSKRGATRVPGFRQKKQSAWWTLPFLFFERSKKPHERLGVGRRARPKEGDNAVTPLAEKCSELTISSIAWNEEIGWPNDLPVALSLAHTLHATRLGYKRWRSLDFNHNTTARVTTFYAACPSLSHSNLHSSEYLVDNTDSQRGWQIDSLPESTHHSHLTANYICLLLINSSPMIHTREHYESINHTIYSATYGLLEVPM